MMKAIPVPTTPRAITAARGGAGHAEGAETIAAGSRMTVLATITQAATPIGGTLARRSFTRNPPTA